MNIVIDTSGLIAGAWYAIGIKNLDDAIEWGCMPIHKYEGEGYWTNDDGEQVETTWDATLQMSVGINSADGYLQQ